jgi:uncharacterized protein (TIGR02271 family)
MHLGDEKMASRKNKLKSATVVGIFPTRTQAENAIRDLKAAEFEDDRLGLIARNASGELTDDSGETYAEEGAVSGAVAGAGIGTLIGIGVVANVVPVIGPALVGGTLGVILTNALGGAAVAGLAGALIGWGIPEEDAKYYEDEVKAGRFLVTVDAGNRSEEAWAIIHRHGGYDRTHAKSSSRSRGRRATASGSTTATDTERTMELKEEEVKVSKRPIKKGEVEVRKEVVTEHKQVDVPVTREEVVIERRPVRGKAAAGDLKGEQVRIPVTEEEVDVQKETKVKEEVKIGKRRATGTRTVGGTVRKEELRVDEEGSAARGPRGSRNRS